jgi:hypothetical protein
MLQQVKRQIITCLDNSLNEGDERNHSELLSVDGIIESGEQYLNCEECRLLGCCAM